jgi:hypothetical protein
MLVRQTINFLAVVGLGYALAAAVLPAPAKALSCEAIGTNYTLQRTDITQLAGDAEDPPAWLAETGEFRIFRGTKMHLFFDEMRLSLRHQEDSQ